MIGDDTIRYDSYTIRYNTIRYAEARCALEKKCFFVKVEFVFHRVLLCVLDERGRPARDDSDGVRVRGLRFDVSKYRCEVRSAEVVFDSADHFRIGMCARTVLLSNEAFDADIRRRENEVRKYLLHVFCVFGRPDEDDVALRVCELLCDGDERRDADTAGTTMRRS